MGNNGLPLFVAVIISAAILGVFVVATGIIMALILFSALWTPAT